MKLLDSTHIQTHNHDKTYNAYFEIQMQWEYRCFLYTFLIMSWFSFENKPFTWPHNANILMETNGRVITCLSCLRYLWDHLTYKCIYWPVAGEWVGLPWLHLVTASGNVSRNAKNTSCQCNMINRIGNLWFLFRSNFFYHMNWRIKQILAHNIST